MADQDELITCPFDKSHRIMVIRMPSHLVKCKKNYQGPPLETCIYNATHLVQQHKMQEHLDKCKSRYKSCDVTFAKADLDML